MSQVLCETAPEPLVRLDLRRKDLMVQKEELLKQSKIKLATVESVKLQIDTLMKVKLFFPCSVRSHSWLLRLLQTFRKRLMSWSHH